MTEQRPPIPERLFDLLADHATQGVPDAAVGELDALRRDGQSPIDPEELELAAAASNLAMLGSITEPLPPALRARIEADALAALPRTPGPGPPPGRDASGPDRGDTGRSSSHIRRNAIAWGIAFGALVLAAAAWWPRVSGGLGAVARATAAAQLAAFEHTAPGVVRASWVPQPTAIAAQAAGEVVWSPERGTGFARIRGLTPNDPSQAQYQIWVYTQSPFEAYPVHAGVFDVLAGGEVVVPLDCKLKVGRATGFAITLERPGGVWVSDGARTALVATLASSASPQR